MGGEALAVVVKALVVAGAFEVVVGALAGAIVEVVRARPKLGGESLGGESLSS
jgi:hypothetical protein